MPRRDGTGPVGMGPMSGRQMGPCHAPGLGNTPSSGKDPGLVSGRGRRCGGGHAYRRNAGGFGHGQGGTKKG